MAGLDIPDRLVLPAQFNDLILEHAQSGLPNEACGLVAFCDGKPVKVFRGTNALASPTRYRMEDDEVVRAIEEIDQRGWTLGAIYHSHPSSPAVPSETDLDEANWPAALMLIVSLARETPELRAYRIGDAPRGYVEVEVTVEDAIESETPAESLKRYGRRILSRIGPATRLARPNPVTSGAESNTVAREKRATIGILGGMGPAATGDLYLKIIEETPAASDQEHIPIVIYADPRVPDRSDALLHGGDDPSPWLVHGARQLEKLGATFLVIPCNTAHAFLELIESEIQIPVLSMLDVASSAIAEGYPGVRRVGLLATTGTIKSEIYQRTLARRGLDVVVPDDDLLEHCVMPAIRAVKANSRHESVRHRLLEAVDYLEQRGAHLILAACTEIPVVLTADDIGLPYLDATAELAKAAVRDALDRDARETSAVPLVAGSGPIWHA